MNIVPLTPQQAFDKALFGIRAQGYKPSHNEYGGCFYRGPDGLKCGVGHMIPDEVFKPEFDKPPSGNSDIRSLLSVGAYYDAHWADGLKALLSGVDKDMLDRIQRAHDEDLGSPRCSSAWESRMQDIAEVFGLTYTAPEVTA